MQQLYMYITIYIVILYQNKKSSKWEIHV